LPARLGQHFLKDEGVRDAIVAATGLTRQDQALEIGPGRGILTRGLLAAAGSVTAVEMDERLAEKLADEYRSEPRLRLVTSDFLKLDLETLGPGPFVVAANLPYSVGAPILQKLLVWPRWRTAVLMFQKEVAERIAAAPGGPDYGLLTLSVLLHAEPELLIEVPRQLFSPPPQVASAVVRLTRRDKPVLEGEAAARFFKIAKAAFGQRRKMASGLIAQALGLPRERVVEAFAGLGVAAGARAQDIPFEAFGRLAAELA
jgi:16S rRNA (adenine1518-N6/adenine1519-N6)-dimethyltransferase